MKIVIADDHAGIRTLYKEILSKQGHQIVAEADNGQDALTSYLELTPDLLIIDHNLGRINGIDVVREITQQVDNARIIICTANPYEILGKAEQLGVKKVLSKPFTIEKFIDSVFHAIHN